MRILKRTILFIFFASIIFCNPLASQEIDVPQFPAWMVEKRLESLNLQTPIVLDYNESVQAYIDVYTLKRREHFSNILSKSKLYFPIFEEYLDKYNLPLELKYLAVIESALDPRATSKSGARGLWQFLYHAGTMFDLKITTYNDDRCDPILSTEAACKYLQYLYRNFNDWQLALAAYNGGVGVVNNAIERSGGERNYWKLRSYLPEAVRGYVPAFIAATYCMNYYSSYDVKEASPQFSFNDIDTIFVRKSISFEQITNAIGISKDDFSFLNPTYTKEKINVTDAPHRIYLPKKFVNEFVKNEPLLYNEEATALKRNIIKNRQKEIHIVKKGEYFHKIAIMYQCKVEDIVKWNNLKTKHLNEGQELVVWIPIKQNKFFFIRNEIDFMADL